MIEVWVKFGRFRWELVPAHTPFATKLTVGEATFNSWQETWRRFDEVDKEIADMTNAVWEAENDEAWGTV